MLGQCNLGYFWGKCLKIVEFVERIGTNMIEKNVEQVIADQNVGYISAFKVTLMHYMHLKIPLVDVSLIDHCSLLKEFIGLIGAAKEGVENVNFCSLNNMRKKLAFKLII